MRLLWLLTALAFGLVGLGLNLHHNDLAALRGDDLILRNKIEAVAFNLNHHERRGMKTVWVIQEEYDDRTLAVRPSRALAVQSLKERHPGIEETGDHVWVTPYGTRLQLIEVSLDGWR